jgi:hypothetical protein
MEQIAYTVAARYGGSAACFSSADFVRLLESRLRAYEALAQSLIGCRGDFIQSDIDGIMQWVELQSSHCTEITRAEEKLGHHGLSGNGALPEYLSPAEVERATELLRRTTQLQHAIQQLNRIHAGLIRKAAHNNAVLRNLYATALVYADPRLGPGASCAGTEE